MPGVATTITDLNPECLLHLFSFLDKDSKKCLSQTCHKLMDIFQEPSLWKLLNFSSPSELTKKNFVLGPALKSLSICWYSSRVKVCNIEDCVKTTLQKSMCSHHLNTVSDFLLQVSKRCPNLRTLTLSGCAHVTDEPLIQIIKLCPDLQSLKLENCSGVTNRLLALVPLFCKRLHTLHLNFCRNLTKKGLLFVKQGCPGLTLQADRSADMFTDRLPSDSTPIKRIPRRLVLNVDWLEA
ncbi:PREDICTED: F-box and leucine-rich protein 22 [Nanorana parkeri]|uniref:F-box and leucine-rich protein 22 n=1 Tax=Nanorana parkeri TaxID=125878 RepID=UPI00085438F3|nr:PREDICTED: F-box and leucine-rich protein 22 [Nanorana parkeri]